MNNKATIITAREYLTTDGRQSIGMAGAAKKKKKTNPMTKLKCKHCLSQSFEILIGKSYGKTKAWQERDHVRNIFKFHCLKCGVTYEFKPEKPSLAIKAAKNKVPFLSNRYKKQYLLKKAMELKALRAKTLFSPNRKQDIKDIEQYLGRYLGIDEPMVLGNWLIVKDKNGQVRVYDDKNKYYRAETFYQKVVKPGKAIK